MTLRFDHAVIATRDLEASAETYRRLGFQVEPGGRHTGKGTRNALIRWSSNYLELIAVDDRDEALQAGPSRVALVEFLDRTAGGFTTFALRTGAPRELDELVVRWRTAGLEVPEPSAAQRIRPDGTVLRWRTAVPGGSSVRQTWPFVIEWPDGARPAAPDASGGSSHDNGAMEVTHVAVVGSDLRLFDAYDSLGLAAMGRPDEPELDAARGVVRLPGVEIELLVPHHGGALAAQVRGVGPGPLQVGIVVSDLDGLAQTLADRGFATSAAWPAGIRLLNDDPAAAPLVFLPSSWTPSELTPRDGGVA